MVNPGYHYVVSLDGMIHSYFDEEKVAMALRVLILFQSMLLILVALIPMANPLITAQTHRKESGTADKDAT